MTITVINTAAPVSRPARLAEAPAPAVDEAARRHAMAAATARTTISLNRSLTVTLFGDGTTGVRMTRVPIGLRQVTAYVELDAADTIGRVTGIDAATGRPLPPDYARLAGHDALRAALRARRSLRAITGAHARPRRLAPLDR